jgi:uracil-DNA glycosylase
MFESDGGDPGHPRGKRLRWRHCASGHPGRRSGSISRCSARRASSQARRATARSRPGRSTRWSADQGKPLARLPNAREIGACLPWLEAKLELIRPQILVCLGATADQALLGRSFRVTEQRAR